MSLDTIAIARELRATDVALLQNEATASAIGKAVSEGAATKSDLHASVAELKATLLTLFVGTQIAVGAIIIAALKL